MRIVEQIAPLKALLRPLANTRKIGLVPTMGALHEGHMSLVDDAKRRSDFVVASIFVNPKQFGPNEDLERYPRDLEGDAAKLEARGVDVVFAPTVDVVYPPGHQTAVTVERTTRGLCGDHRPGHFDGVTTVVLALFHIVRPDVAIFGEKDYQQLAVIRAMARDLHLDVEIRGAPIVREADGLAMSSRNMYLSPDERRSALSLSRGLRAARDRRAAGETSIETLLAAAKSELEVEAEYLEIRHADTLDTIATADGPSVMLVAARVGTTRLIDNIRLDP